MGFEEFQEINCTVSLWEAWNECSKSCGTGSRLRSRQIVVEAANGGKSCDATVESADCNTNPCQG